MDMPLLPSQNGTYVQGLWDLSTPLQFALGDAFVPLILSGILSSPVAKLNYRLCLSKYFQVQYRNRLSPSLCGDFDIRHSIRRVDSVTRGLCAAMPDYAVQQGLLVANGEANVTQHFHNSKISRHGMRCARDTHDAFNQIRLLPYLYARSWMH